MPGMQWLNLIFQVISQMAEAPIFSFFHELLELSQGLTGMGRYDPPGSGTHETLMAVHRQIVLMVIQKTTNVEPVGPVQHLQFGLPEILYGERPEFAFHPSCLEVIFIVEAAATAIVEQSHIFKFFIDPEILFLSGAFLATALFIL